MFQGLGTQVLSVVAVGGAQTRHLVLIGDWAKLSCLVFPLFLALLIPSTLDSQPALYGGRGPGKSTDAQKSWDKPMTECERVQVDENQQFGEKPSIPGACKQRQIRG